MYSLGPQSEGETLTLSLKTLFERMKLKGGVLVLLAWQVTTWVERPTGLEGCTSTPLYPSDQAGGALVTSSEHISSSMLETFVTSTMVSPWEQF